MNDIYHDAIEYAKKFAEAAPKGFETATYQTALAHYLVQNESKPSIKSEKMKKSTMQKPASPDYLSELLESNYDWSLTNIRSLPPLGQYLKILKIGKTEFQIDALSSEDLKKILNEKFRIDKTVNTIGMSMMGGVGKYVDRIKRSNCYCYKITSGGEVKLQQFEEKSGEKYV